MGGHRVTFSCALRVARVRARTRTPPERGVDPIEAAQITGHSPAVWARSYARSFGKAQRDEARDRMLAHGFGAVTDNDEDEVRAEDEAAAAS